MYRTLLLLTAAVLLAVPVNAQFSLNGLFINEILPDPSGTTFNFDTDGDGSVESSDEFIEFYNSGASSVDLSGYRIYDNQGLQFTFPVGASIAAGGFVAYVTEYSGTIPANIYSFGVNGDGLNNNGDGIYFCAPSGDYVAAGYNSVDAPSLPNNASSFCTNFLGFDDLGADTDGLSLKRQPDGSATIAVGGPTPGATNQPGVAVTSGSAPGWRMLSVPGSGVTVNDLAATNLVRGIATDDTDPPNLYTVYGGDQTPGENDGYTPPASPATTLTPGAGFFWYFFDFGNPPTVDPDALGSIRSLPISIDANVSLLVADQTVQFPVRANNDGFYLAGNPFDSDFDLSGISVTSNPTGTPLTVQDIVSVWSPGANGGAGGYVAGSLTGAGASGLSSPWQGFWLEIVETATSTPSTTVGADVTYAIASAGASGAVFIGRQAAYSDLKLELRGTATDGRALTNEASLLFHEEATEGWDRFDSSSPGSFGTPYVLAGLLGQRGDEEVWKYQDARSLADGVYTFDLAYTGFGVGTAYEFAWPSLDNVPEAWTLTLRDRMTGTEVDLRTTASYAFEAMEGEPEARFEVIVGASSVANEGDAVPESFAVGEAYPNPTTSVATLAVTVDRAQDVEVSVYDVLGRLVLADAVTLRGGAAEQIEVGVAALPAGTYVVRVTGEAMAATRRLTVVR